MNIKPKVIKICLHCKKKFSGCPSAMNGRLVCGIQCKNSMFKPWWTGKKRPKGTCNKIADGLKGKVPWNKGLLGYRSGIPKPWMKKSGSDSSTWKGDRVTYRPLHIWVQKELGTPNKCVHCGKIGYGHSMHWANVDHKYRRNTKDWLRLCPRCHKSFDKKLRLII